MQVEIGVAEDVATQSEEQQVPRPSTSPSLLTSGPEQQATSSAEAALQGNGHLSPGSKPGATKSARARQAKKRRAAQAAANAMPSVSAFGASAAPASSEPTSHLDQDGSAPLPGAAPLPHIPEGRPQPHSRPTSSKSPSKSSYSTHDGSAGTSSSASRAVPQPASPTEADLTGSTHFAGQTASDDQGPTSETASREESPEDTAASADRELTWGLPMMSALSGRTQAYLKGARLYGSHPDAPTTASDSSPRDLPDLECYQREREEQEAGSQPLAPTRTPPQPPSHHSEPEAGSQPLTPSLPSNAAFKQNQKQNQPAPAKGQENGHPSKASNLEFSGSMAQPGKGAASRDVRHNVPAVNGRSANGVALGLERAASGGLKRGFFGNRKPLQSGSSPAEPSGSIASTSAEQHRVAGTEGIASNGLNGTLTDEPSSSDESMPELESAAASNASSAAASPATAWQQPLAGAAAPVHSLAPGKPSSAATPPANSPHPQGMAWAGPSSFGEISSGCARLKESNPCAQARLSSRSSWPK